MIEMNPQKDTYTVPGLRCGNCCWSQPSEKRLIQIPKGTTVAGTPCPQCGCMTLSPRRLS